jgi:hypothetical protein
VSGVLLTVHSGKKTCPRQDVFLEGVGRFLSPKSALLQTSVVYGPGGTRPPTKLLGGRRLVGITHHFITTLRGKEACRTNCYPRYRPTKHVWYKVGRRMRPGLKTRPENTSLGHFHPYSYCKRGKDTLAHVSYHLCTPVGMLKVKVTKLSPGSLSALTIDY